jgi:hypothetical protein
MSASSYSAPRKILIPRRSLPSAAASASPYAEMSDTPPVMNLTGRKHSRDDDEENDRRDDELEEETSSSNTKQSAKRSKKDDSEEVASRRSSRARRPPGNDAPSLGQQFREAASVGMPDTHTAGGGGGMANLRTVADDSMPADYLLTHHVEQMRNNRGLFYNGDLELRGLGKTRVKSAIEARDPREHTQRFTEMTGGESSSTQYQKSLGTARPDTDYEILHGMGHGQGGKQTQVPTNLASASHGANSEMIPPDDAISGNTHVSVDTKFLLRPHTERAERIVMAYHHDEEPDPHIPFYHNTIDGDRPKMTRSEYRRHAKGEEITDSSTPSDDAVMSDAEEDPASKKREAEVAWMRDNDRIKKTINDRLAIRMALHHEIPNAVEARAKAKVPVPPSSSDRMQD